MTALQAQPGQDRTKEDEHMLMKLSDWEALGRGLIWAGKEL